MAVRQHGRGPHPSDAGLFGGSQLPALRTSTSHLSWLLSRGYAPNSSLKLVGDRFNLVSRQRTAVMRSACSDASQQSRAEKRIAATGVAGRAIEIDTFNLLITLEAALSGGVILLGRDGVYRDMASIHGSYRKVTQTQRAIELAAEYFREQGAGQVLWRIDRPVSNSGRLRSMLIEYAEQQQLDWEVELNDDPDRVLGSRHTLVASADAAVLDRVDCWTNLARGIIDAHITTAWIIDMNDGS